MANKPTWYDIKAQSETGRAQVFIFGVIVDYKWDEDDVTAKEFIDALKPLGDIDLHINSPGGSIPAGNAIYNALRRHKGDVAIYIAGLAASMASVVAMAGNRVIMPANAMLMIHDPWTIALGNAAEMRKTADVLDKFKAGLVAAYCDKSGMDQTEVERLMSEETWITAAEAVEMGFADEMEEPIVMAAQFDLSRYRNAPKALMSQPPRPEAKKKPAQGGNQIMKLDDLKKNHPDLVAQIETEARQGMIAQAELDAARAEAVGAETARIMGVVAAALGEEPGKKIAAIVSANLTAEQVKDLGLSASASASAAGSGAQQQMLDAITAASAQGVRPAAGRVGENQGLNTSAIYSKRREVMTGK